MARFGDEALRSERVRALRALLLTPLLTAGEELTLVQRHQAFLKDWLSRNAGWRLQVQYELARLYKFRSDTGDSTRGLAGFTPFRYALLCLALAALERSERQTTLGRLADEVGRLVAADPELERAGFRLDLSQRAHRSDLVAVVRFLLERQALVRVHGDEQQYLAERGDALYNVDRRVLGTFLSVRRGPSTIAAESLEDRLAQLCEEPWPDGGDARNQRIRWQIVRRLLDDPALYLADLGDEETAYYTSQRAHMAREIEYATGLVPEVRREGMAMVDPDGELSDVALPEEGTDGHLTLLVAEHLARCSRVRPGEPVGRASLESFVADLVQRYGRHWRKDAREPGREAELTRETLARLEALGLVVRSEDGVIPRPALARYALAELPDDEVRAVQAELFA